MTKEAANSLLKVLEEPPANVVFILVTSRWHMLLETIISRCYAFDFMPVSALELGEELKKQGYEEENALLAAKLSGGRVGRAIEILKPAGLKNRQQAVSIIFNLVKTDHSWVWEFGAALEKSERHEILGVFTYLEFLLRDLLLLVGGHEIELLLNIDLLAELTNMKMDWTIEGLLKACVLVKEASKAVEANANVRLTSEALLWSLIRLGEEIKEG
jgi:DNA polymerase-3 subunit delta'